MVGAGAVQSVWRLDYWLDDRGSIPDRGRNVSLRHSALQPLIQCVPVVLFGGQAAGA
jgi:hypothetical protein